MRVDHPPAGEAGETDVRQRGERAAVAHRLERGQRCVQAGAVVRADRGELVTGQPVDRGTGGDAAERLRVLVEGQHRDDRQPRDAPHRVERRRQLVEVEEGLDHEQVDAPAFEELGLLGEDRSALVRREAVELAERADRAADVDVAPGDVAGLPGELDARFVDAGDVVLEVLRAQLVAVRAEGVRLDQLGAGADEARVQGDDALRRADVRLLRAAKPRHRARDEHAHAAVRDHRRLMFKPFFEGLGHRGK